MRASGNADRIDVGIELIDAHKKTRNSGYRKPKNGAEDCVNQKLPVAIFDAQSNETQ